MPRSPRTERTVVLLAGGVLLLAYWRIFGRLLPPRHGLLGADYEYFLPTLLDGYYWVQANGLFAVPWFTPALCGGVPWFPNPESIFYSAPQLLTLVTDPLNAVRLTFLAFAAVGFAGAYVLLRRTFRLSLPASLLGATLFLFNGYYAHRLLVGHICFHPFMLVPWMAHLASRTVPRGTRDAIWQLAVDALGIGACVAYMVHAGDHNLTAALIATTAVGLMRVLRGGWLGALAIRLTGGVAVAVLLSAAKLASGFYFLASFPRSGYTYYGAPDLGSLLVVAGRALFLAPSSATTNLLMQGTGFTLTQHELEYGVTVVPAVVLAAWVLVRLWALASGGPRPRRPDLRRALVWLSLGLVLSLPLAVNYYTPGWYAVLKSIPILRTINVLARWLNVYIVALSVLTALAVESIPWRAVRTVTALVAILLVVVLNATTNRAYYVRQHYATSGYDPARVVDAYHRAAGAPPAITTVVRRHVPPNEAMLDGASAIRCYEAIFGYGLEWFPPTGLAPGPALAERDGHLNVLNPACFVFPAANGCRPGDRFTVSERTEAEAFLAHRAISFRAPLGQRIANQANLVALLAGAALLIAYAVRHRRRPTGGP